MRRRLFPLPPLFRSTRDLDKAQRAAVASHSRKVLNRRRRRDRKCLNSRSSSNNSTRRLLPLSKPTSNISSFHRRISTDLDCPIRDRRQRITLLKARLPCRTNINSVRTDTRPSKLPLVRSSISHRSRQELLDSPNIPIRPSPKLSTTATLSATGTGPDGSQQQSPPASALADVRAAFWKLRPASPRHGSALALPRSVAAANAARWSTAPLAEWIRSSSDRLRPATLSSTAISTANAADWSRRVSVSRRSASARRRRDFWTAGGFDGVVERGWDAKFLVSSSLFLLFLALRYCTDYKSLPLFVMQSIPVLSNISVPVLRIVNRVSIDLSLLSSFSRPSRLPRTLLSLSSQSCILGDLQQNPTRSVFHFLSCGGPANRFELVGAVCALKRGSENVMANSEIVKTSGSERGTNSKVFFVIANRLLESTQDCRRVSKGH